MTSTEKRSAIAAFSAPGPVGGYELDHLVPLGIGGSPNSPRNLWPEPGASPNPKDDLEAALHDQVCARTLDLANAQQLAAGDWVAAYRQVLGHDPTG